MRTGRGWAMVALLSVMAAGCGDDDNGGGGSQALVEPPRIVSRKGVLRTRFTAADRSTTIAGAAVRASFYNGLYIPPTLFVKPGDVIRLALRNRIAQPTNLHYHGMNVSPLGNSDNVFVHVGPGEDFDYEIAIPPDHPVGMFYYHAHQHGLTEFQIGSGLSGGLIVEGLLEPFPELRDLRQHVMLLKDIQIEDGMVADPPDSSMPTMRTLNGQVNPTIAMRPGETQLWRIGNVGADIYYHLQLEGHTFYEVARDGNRHDKIVPRDEILLPTSSRVEVLVQAGPAGHYALKTLAINMGPMGDMYPEVTLATMVAQGAAQQPIVLPSSLLPVDDLRGQPVQQQRSYRFSENMDGDQFYINGKQFDPNRVDTVVQLGDLEEWTLDNCSGENHVFHIHQLDFQVVEVNGVPQPFVGRQDTVNLDFRNTDGAEDCPTDADPHGRVKVLVPFTNPVILGKFVYHCHIGEHEDNGMMQVIEVVDGPPFPGGSHGH